MEKQKNKITIAIDGWSSCGKSTLAKALAKALNYTYVDSGAMYRGVAFYCLQNDLIDGNEVKEKELIAALPTIHLSFHPNQQGGDDLWLNNTNVEKEIRTLRVSNVVSPVAKIKEVRAHLVKQQQRMGEKGGIVMDGRDIGSVVFPNAELKIFLTASVEVRTQRRFDELTKKGETVTKEEVMENLKARDEMDSTRKESPLIQTPDAVVLDNSNLTPEEQLNMCIEWVQKIINKN